MSDDLTNKLPRTTDEMLGEMLNRLERLETSFNQLFKQETLLTEQLAELRERMETGFRETNERQDRLETGIRDSGNAKIGSKPRSGNSGNAKTGLKKSF